MKTCLVTGGAGFIGASVLRYLLAHTRASVVNFDKLSYAGNRASVQALEGHTRYRFYHGDILDRPALDQVFMQCQPDAVLHLAAETHVDRSIDAPGQFLRTNVEGSFILLEASLAYWRGLASPRQDAFRFIHVSSDEVYGELGDGEPPFTESSPYGPGSPYAATKAAADHLALSWWRTYGLPVVLTHCSNNYGPWQYPEKLIPLCLLNALDGRPLPIYGDGQQQRDWLYVEDHAAALCRVWEGGRPGERYNIGGTGGVSNIELIRLLCDCLEQLRATGQYPVLQACRAGLRFEELIEHVQDRPGHDRRYAIDASRMANELGWKPRVSLEVGLARTASWYLENREWALGVLQGHYDRGRLGLL